MSYNSKRTITSMTAGCITVIAYIIYALSRHSPAPDDLKGWAVTMLVFIGIGVAAVILVQIVFHIVFAAAVAAKERGRDDKTVERIIASAVLEDERDKLIGLKSSHIAYVFAGLGFLAALISLAFGGPVLAALHIIFGATAVGSVVEGIASVYFYEKGV